LEADRRVEVACSLDASAVPKGEVRLRVELHEGDRLLASAEQAVRVEKTGITDIALTLTKLGAIKLWQPDAPNLYRVVATLIVDGQPRHDHAVRIGFREA